MSAGVDTSSSGGKKGGKVRAKKMNLNVDMAPMCDLGFLLITFFMFTTTFIKPNIMHLVMPPKLDTPPPPSEQPKVDLSNSFTIIVGKDDKVYWHQKDQSLDENSLNETNYTKDGLRKEIIAAKARARDKDKFTILIKPTEDATYGNLVDVLDEMEITKSGKYGIQSITPWEERVYEQKVK